MEKDIKEVIAIINERIMPVVRKNSKKYEQINMELLSALMKLHNSLKMAEILKGTKDGKK